MPRLIIIKAPPQRHLTLVSEVKVYDLSTDFPHFADKENACPPFADIKAKMGLEAEDYLEHLTIKYEGKPAHLFCDENGRIKGLAANPVASYVVAAYNVGAFHDFVGPIAIWTGKME